MTYDAFESSKEGGSPVSLFLFVNGNTDHAYTNHTSPIDHDGRIYQPASISPGKISTSGDMTKNQFKINVDHGTSIAALMRGTPPSKSVSIVVMDGHLEDPDNEFIVSWSGLVLGASRKGSEVELTCDNVGSSIRGIGVTRNWQLTCPYMLYSVGYCDADQAAATVATAPINIVKNVLTLPSGWRGAYDLEDYIHGLVQWTSGNGVEVRSIIDVAATDDIKLGGPPHDIEFNQVVEVSLGCNRRSNKCGGLHNNLVNYGGQENIPVENPTGRNIF